jgi:hypothetical protein
MSIYTLSFVVLLVVGTPFSFKIKHVELLISSHFVNKWRFNILIRVSKAAELFVVAFLSSLSAKLSFVFFNMVQPFYFIVSVAASNLFAVFIGARVNTVVKLCCATASIKQTVILGTLLWVVNFNVLTFQNFKTLQF